MYIKIELIRVERHHVIMILSQLVQAMAWHCQLFQVMACCLTASSIVLASHPCTCVLQRQLSQLHTLKLPEFFHFHGDFHQKWHFAHPKISFAHPELPFLAKSMASSHHPKQCDLSSIKRSLSSYFKVISDGYFWWPSPFCVWECSYFLSNDNNFSLGLVHWGESLQ